MALSHQDGWFYLYCDGASRGNPGPSAYGIALYQGPSVVFTRGEKIPDTTNNVAEYEGLLQGLILSVKEGVKKLIVRSDSQLLVRQLEGKYKVKATHLIPLHEKARTLSKNFEMIRFEHVPREENKLADRLANEALDGK